MPFRLIRLLVLELLPHLVEPILDKAIKTLDKYRKK